MNNGEIIKHFNAAGDEIFPGSVRPLPQNEYTVDEGLPVTAEVTGDDLPFYCATLVAREIVMPPQVNRDPEDAANGVAGVSDHNFYLRLERAAVFGGITQDTQYFHIKKGRNCDEFMRQWNSNDCGLVIELLQKLLKTVPLKAWSRAGDPLVRQNSAPDHSCKFQ